MDEDKQVRELPPAVRSLIGVRTGDAVYVVDPDYKILHWDSQMESLTGALSQEALGKPCYEAVMGEREDGGPFCAHGCSVMHVAQAHRPVSNFEMRIKTRSGDRRWMNVSNLTVETEEGPYLIHLLLDFQGTHDALEMARGLATTFLQEGGPSPEEEGHPCPHPEATRSPADAVRGQIGEGDRQGALPLRGYGPGNHVRSLLQALGAHSQLEVLAKAREMGVLGG